MSIETLLEAAKFVEWSSQIQHTARDNETRPGESTKGPPPGIHSIPVPTSPPAGYPMGPRAPTTSPQPQPMVVSPRAPKRKPGTGIRSPWKLAGPGPTSPRPLEVAAYRPRMVVRGPPPRAVTPPAASGASYMGVQYRPLAPLPSTRSPNGGAQPLVGYRRVESFDEGSNQSGDSDRSKGNEEKDKKSDTREVHNKLEKNRRAHLKDCFDNLKAQVPNMEDKKIKTSNLSILQGALRCLQALKRKERELEHQLEKLARQKITYQQRLAKLKMEKRLTEDQLPWNQNKEDVESEEEVEEMPEERAAEDDGQVSTSTASEAEEEERKSRAQSPELSPQTQPKRTKKSIVQGQPKQQQSIKQGQPQQQPTTKPVPEVRPKVTRSVTKEIHSGPYVLSRPIITHMAQQATPSANRLQPTERLPIISQLARRQAGRPIIGAFEERLGVINKNIPSGFNLTNVSTSHSSKQSEPTMVVQQSNTQSGNRQTVSQLLGKQTTPGLRGASMRPAAPSNHTPVIQAPIRQPVFTGAPYPSVVGVTAASTIAAPYPVISVSTAPPRTTYPGGAVVGVTTASTSATVVTIASKQTPTTSVMSIAVSQPAVTTSAVKRTAASRTVKSVIQSNVVTTIAPPMSTLQAISPAPAAGTQIHTLANGMTLANVVAPPAGVVPTRTIAQPFLSQLPVQPSALTRVLFTQPPVAAYSLAQTQLANPLIPSALPQTVIRPPTAVAITTVTQSVITQIISTQPMTTNASAGNVTTQVNKQAITTPAIASMVPPGIRVAPYHPLAALGMAPYPVTLGPPLVLNKALVTTTPAYTTLPLGTAALHKLTMSSIPFQAPTLPITAARTAQAAIFSPIAGLRTAAPAAVVPATTTKVLTIPVTTPIAVTTPVAMTTPVGMTAIRPRVSVDPSTLTPVTLPTVTVASAATPPPTITKGGIVPQIINQGGVALQNINKSGVRPVAPKSGGVRITVPGKDVPKPSNVRVTVPSKDKPTQKVTT